MTHYKENIYCKQNWYLSHPKHQQDTLRSGKQWDALLGKASNTTKWKREDIRVCHDLSDSCKFHPTILTSNSWNCNLNSKFIASLSRGINNSSEITAPAFLPVTGRQIEQAIAQLNLVTPRCYFLFLSPIFWQISS